MKALLITLFVFILISPAARAQELGDEAYAVVQSAFMYDAGYPLHARISGIRKSHDVAFEKIVFNSFHDGLVPGLLSVPTTGKAPYPVVLLMHGLTADKSHWLDNEFTHGGEVTRGLLDKGYAVMALDAQYHGDRAVYNDYIDPGEMIFQRNWGIRYSNLLTQTIVDYRRAIDYLASRDDIDTNRVGIVGYSMGGHMTFILGAVEPRIKAVVACVVPATPGMPIAASTFARSMGNAPLLMMMAEHDQFYSVEQAQQLYDAVPGDDKAIHFFDSGHSLPVEYVAQVLDWIEETL